MFPAASINGSMGKFLDRVHTLLGDSLNVFVTWARIFLLVGFIPGMPFLLQVSWAGLCFVC
jgi:flagellar biosynthesis component FlhA